MVAHEPVSRNMIEQTTAIRNRTERQLVFYLEPWGDEFEFAPGQEYVVVGRGPERGSGFVVEHDEESVTVVAWSGSTVRVFAAGVEIGGHEERPSVPAV